MHILIAGGCGFVGTNLALFFTEKGHKVICVDNMSRESAVLNSQAMHDTYRYDEDKSIHVAMVPIQDWTVWNGFKHGKIDHIDIILNCSAQSRSTAGQDDPMVDYHGNVSSAVACAELAREYGCPLIHWSTNKVYSEFQVNCSNQTEVDTRYSSNRYGDMMPVFSTQVDEGQRSIYGATKYAAEVLLNEWSTSYNIPTIINRFSCMAGPHQYSVADQGWVAHWMYCHMFGKPLEYIGWKGKQVRDVLNIADVCQLVNKQIEYLLMCNQLEATSYSVPAPQCLTYNVGGGPGNTLSLRECTTLCERITGKSVEITTVDEPRLADQRVYVSDIREVCDKFDWKPMYKPLRTLENVYEWALKNTDTLEQYYGSKITME